VVQAMPVAGQRLRPVEFFLGIDGDDVTAAESGCEAGQSPRRPIARPA